MNGDAGNALQKLELSVIGLAVDKGDVRSRLNKELLSYFFSK